MPPLKLNDMRTHLQQFRHQLKIIHIKSRRERIKKPRLLPERITKRMRGPDPHNHIIPHLRIYILLTRRMKPHRPFRNEETLIVHFMPVGRRAGAVRSDDEFSGAETVVGVGAVFHDAQGEGGAEVDDLAGFGGDEVDGDFGDGEGGRGVFAGCHHLVITLDG